MQAQTVARQAQKKADLAISQRDARQAQPEDATLTGGHRDSQLEDAVLAASHRDSLLEDATLAASQRDSLQNQPKIGKARANPIQQDVASAPDRSQPHQEPQSATSEALPAPDPTKPQAENEQATASQKQAHRLPSESARPQRIHRTLDTKTRNSAASTPATPFLSQLRDQWNRIWHIRSNNKRSDYHSNQ